MAMVSASVYMIFALVGVFYPIKSTFGNRLALVITGGMTTFCYLVGFGVIFP